MKTSILLFCILAFSLPQIIFSQQRIYLDQEGNEVDSTAEFSKYFELTVRENGWTYVKEYNDERRLRSEGAYSVYSEKERIREGQHRNYRSESGELWYIETCALGEQQQLESYYPGGKVKRRETYENGKFKSGACFTESGEEMPFTRFWAKPEYPGGDTALLTFLNSNVKYPARARENGIEGTVVLSFVVQKDGSVTDIEVVKGVGGGCTAEAQLTTSAAPMAPRPAGWTMSR